MPFEHVVIVGAGHAGGCAAGALRSSGFAGKVTLIGAEPFPPYERPPLSKELLLGTIPSENTYLRARHWYAKSNIDLRVMTEVTAIDRSMQRIELSNGGTIPYDALILTLGARPRVLPFADRQPHIFYLRDIGDALALRERLQTGVRVLIIGAGFIGLEVATAARKAGCDVMVIEAASQPLARVAPAEIGAYVAELHRRNGVDLQLNCSLAAVDSSKPSCFAHTTDGRLIEADLIVIGVGAVPNVELAEAAGLAADDGIVVDQFGKTSDPSIFAAGDVTKHFNPLLDRAVRLEAWQNAQSQASAVANVVAGGAEPYAEIPWLWTNQFDVNIQLAGAPIEWDEIVYRGEPTSRSFMVFQLLDHKLVGSIGVNAGRDMRFARVLMAAGRTIQGELLADRKTTLQDLCRQC
jgi:3-phenylpropionate/trans-cinnamate dioxygenase ferredoxin reductase component